MGKLRAVSKTGTKEEDIMATIDRFWLTFASDEDENTITNTDGWWGVVDEREGGIVAYAGTQERAEMIRQLLILHPDYV